MYVDSSEINKEIKIYRDVKGEISYYFTDKIVMTTANIECTVKDGNGRGSQKKTLLKGSTIYITEVDVKKKNIISVFGRICSERENRVASVHFNIPVDDTQMKRDIITHDPIPQEIVDDLNGLPQAENYLDNWFKRTPLLDMKTDYYVKGKADREKKRNRNSVIFYCLLAPILFLPLIGIYAFIEHLRLNYKSPVNETFLHEGEAAVAIVLCIILFFVYFVCWRIIDNCCTEKLNFWHKLYALFTTTDAYGLVEDKSLYEVLNEEEMYNIEVEHIVEKKPLKILTFGKCRRESYKKNLELWRSVPKKTEETHPIAVNQSSNVEFGTVLNKN